MATYENEMLKVLGALDEADALKHCVISGSWAMFFYKRIFTGFVPRLETTDLDLYLPNPKRHKLTIYKVSLEVFLIFLTMIF